MASLEALTTSFALIFLAEMGDKTQVVLFSLSARAHARLPVLAGACLGFVVVDGLAILFGTAIASLVDGRTLAAASGALFIGIGILFLRSQEPHEEGVSPVKRHSSLFAGTALLITAMEVGDKSQILSLALAARFNNVALVFAGVLGALATLSIMAVVAGSRIAGRVSEHAIKRFSGAIFVAIGIITLAGAV